MNTLLLPVILAAHSLTAQTAEPVAPPDTQILVDDEVDLHRVVDGRSCTYARKNCVRTVEVVNRARVVIRPLHPIKPGQEGLAQEAARISRGGVGWCMSRLIDEQLPERRLGVLHRSVMPTPRAGGWPMEGMAFIERCVEHQTRELTLPEGAPAMHIDIEILPPPPARVLKAL